jgi:hypothetical protein
MGIDTLLGRGGGNLPRRPLLINSLLNAPFDGLCFSKNKDSIASGLALHVPMGCNLHCRRHFPREVFLLTLPSLFLCFTISMSLISLDISIINSERKISALPFGCQSSHIRSFNKQSRFQLSTWTRQTESPLYFLRVTPQPTTNQHNRSRYR